MQNNFNVNQQEAKGFIKKLLTLDSFMTPKIIYVFYIIGLILLALFFVGCLLSTLAALFTGNIANAFAFLISAFVGTLIYTFLLRMWVELTIVAFKSNEYLKKISEK
ncbi:DUF4282 domain-containing protein [Bartonella sp. HY329]|uniref:DUF4282 domain-containing protein n=1 Tax=unclassified Bartonella TaxID=2645622 RepID=UPI0021C806AE|nr:MULTISPECIES: DUF4282 domain-containing protein [unclassified Bartonella]UXM94754.1 DUF4282 domain-containing protein [Bartonella sp. HY329]UXN09077.1 DUF4282 domain-containing protein [Bartonella sp. HY328]